MRLTRQMMFAVLGLVLFAASCGGDPDAELRTAIDQKIAGDLAFADESNAECVGDKILIEHDRLDLESRGLGTTDLLTGDGDLTELFGDRDGELPKNVFDCVDADQRFSDAVTSAGAVTPTPGCIDAAALAEPKQVGVVLYGDDVEIDEELRELVRACLSEEDFSTLFGLDQPADLAAALIVDPLELMDDEDDGALKVSAETSACMGSAIVDELGVEALDNAGVSVEQPVIFHASVDLDETQGAFVQSAISTCEAIAPMLTHVLKMDEPEAAACAVESLTEADLVSLFQSHLDPGSVRTSSSYRDGLGDCITALLEEQFGAAEATAQQRISARLFADGFISQAAPGYKMSQYETKCVYHRTRILLTPEIAEALEQSEATSLQDGLTFYDDHPGLLAKTLELNGCFNADSFITWQFVTGGFSQATIDCVFSIVDSDARKASMDVAALFQEDASPERVEARLDAAELMIFAVDECATASELAALDDVQDLSA